MEEFNENKVQQEEKVTSLEKSIDEQALELVMSCSKLKSPDEKASLESAEVDVLMACRKLDKLYGHAADGSITSSMSIREFIKLWSKGKDSSSFNAGCIFLEAIKLIVVLCVALSYNWNFHWYYISSQNHTWVQIYLTSCLWGVYLLVIVGISNLYFWLKNK